MLAITLIHVDDTGLGEWELTINGNGDLDGECHVLMLLSDEEAEELKRVVADA